MSLDAGWRYLKIVADSGRVDEIVGGLKNALDRGSSLEQAKMTFFQAGYSQEEIQAALQRVPSLSSRVSKPLSAPDENGNSRANASGAVFTPQKKKKAGKGLTIALIILGVLVVVGGAAVYFFKDQLF